MTLTHEPHTAAWDTDLSLGSGLVDPLHLPRVAQDPAEDEVIASLWHDYLQKTYMKTASLFAKAMECAVILGGATAEDPLREAAVSFGACLGMAFQVCRLACVRTIIR